jgi:ribosomal protein L7Ae-like RNA K-turn-binding protein
VASAAAKNLFAKAARERVVVPSDLVDRVVQLLLRDMLDRLGLARRAGQAVAGFEKVRALLVEGAAGLLFAAADGAADGRRKLRLLAADVPLVECLSSAELAAALGRDTVVHAAVRQGSFAERLAMAAVRLEKMRDARDRLTD